MLALYLLFGRSWVLPFMMLNQIHLVTRKLAILGGEALSWESVLFLHWTPPTLNCNNHLLSFGFLLIDGVVPVHLYNLTDLNSRVASVFGVEVRLLVEIVLGAMVVGPSKKSCRFGVHSLLVVGDGWPERVAACFWPLFGPTTEAFFLFILRI